MYTRNFNKINFSTLSYIKHFALKSILIILISSCSLFKKNNESSSHDLENQLESDDNELFDENGILIRYKIPILGIQQTEKYIHLLENKNVGVVSNQSSILNETHLVDTLLKLNIKVNKVFSPEHGFRGDADAGENIGNEIDKKTGLPIISLYGNHKKPTKKDLENIDCFLFDLQDVGVRFYTYISTLHYIMEACAENNIPLILLDRPNPNAHYIDGPVRDSLQKSFVGMHPVPIVYGMTIGEYAQMINGENWLNNNLKCNLKIITCKNYKHKQKYILPIAPSPNLRTEKAIALYPSLCLFEGTTVSVGRGTERPFEMFGHPKFPKTDFIFTPKSSFGSKSPLWMNQTCNGYDLGKSLNNNRMYEFNINWVLEAKKLLGDSIPFINQKGFFDRLAGTSNLRTQIENGWTAREIRHSWKADLDNFKIIRKKYLLYE